jgi:hypothetical protein
MDVPFGEFQVFCIDVWTNVNGLSERSEGETCQFRQNTILVACILGGGRCNLTQFQYPGRRLFFLGLHKRMCRSSASARGCSCGDSEPKAVRTGRNSLGKARTGGQRRSTGRSTLRSKSAMRSDFVSCMTAAGSPKSRFPWWSLSASAGKQPMSSKAPYSFPNSGYRRPNSLKSGSLVYRVR